ncbi:hypothetical protein [Nakamurella endophytica]|uniref:Uncharacterized protein n=1 Tax=Nakamurella endophytica TaxID=1748367 RepID=A0A917WK99_9ACTN|nr:hypothetical protein [Nakamurella endophytica]GGM10350.1 hypothetical protein GCM10011594_32810 [Nakamurella endophytica]
MPLETPEDSARATRRVQLGCLGVLLVAMAAFAGLAVWSLVSGRGIGLRGWLFIVCFLAATAGVVRVARRSRQPRADRT